MPTRDGRRRAALDPVELLPPLPKNLSRAEAYARIDELYAQLPPLLCKGSCQDSCTGILAPELEYRRIEEMTRKDIRPHLTAEEIKALYTKGTMVPCPALGPLNNCTVHQLRPFICRAYGIAPGMRCPHGCVPDTAMTDDEIYRLLAKIEQISRHITGQRCWPVE